MSKIRFACLVLLLLAMVAGTASTADMDGGGQININDGWRYSTSQKQKVDGGNQMAQFLLQTAAVAEYRWCMKLLSVPAAKPFRITVDCSNDSRRPTDSAIFGSGTGFSLVCWSWHFELCDHVLHHPVL